jgi:hypothetical protein
MQSKLESLINLVYRKWKLDQPQSKEPHPDEEDLTCLLENKCSEEEMERIKQHLIACDRCAEAFALNLELETKEAKEVPEELVMHVKDLLAPEDKASLLEVVLKLKDKVWELISTTGDVLVGQELVPAPILRSRSMRDFKDEITILKDFKDIRVEARIENQGAGAFNLTVMVKEKMTQKVMKDLRVTLLKDNLELESYVTGSGAVVFEHVILGQYKVEISTIDSKLASVLLDIKV